MNDSPLAIPDLSTSFVEHYEAAGAKLTTEKFLSDFLLQEHKMLDSDQITLEKLIDEKLRRIKLDYQHQCALVHTYGRFVIAVARLSKAALSPNGDFDEWVEYSSELAVTRLLDTARLAALNDLEDRDTNALSHPIESSDGLRCSLKRAVGRGGYQSRTGLAAVMASSGCVPIKTAAITTDSPNLGSVIEVNSILDRIPIIVYSEDDIADKSSVKSVLLAYDHIISTTSPRKKAKEDNKLTLFEWHTYSSEDQHLGSFVWNFFERRLSKVSLVDKSHGSKSDLEHRCSVYCLDATNNSIFQCHKILKTQDSSYLKLHLHWHNITKMNHVEYLPLLNKSLAKNFLIQQREFSLQQQDKGSLQSETEKKSLYINANISGSVISSQSSIDVNRDNVGEKPDVACESYNFEQPEEEPSSKKIKSGGKFGITTKLLDIAGRKISRVLKLSRAKAKRFKELRNDSKSDFLGAHLKGRCSSNKSNPKLPFRITSCPEYFYKSLTSILLRHRF